jgi:hypothetical protein
MRNTHTFVIESDKARHDLLVDGQIIASFSTLEAAEVAASGIASRVLPGALLKFELDFKWTLSDLEMRVARLEWESGDNYTTMTK